MRWAKEYRERVERLIARRLAAGQSDAQVAEAEGVNPATIYRFRKRSGLAAVCRPGNDRHRARCRAFRRAYRHQNGYDPMARYHQAGRLRMIGLGWPAGVGPAQARNLAIFEARGPLTRQEFSAAAGRCNDVLDRLHRPGWIVAVGTRPVPGVRPHYIYDLSHDVKLGRERARAVK